MPKHMHCRLQLLDALRQIVASNSFGQVGLIQHSLLWEQGLQRLCRHQGRSAGVDSLTHHTA